MAETRFSTPEVTVLRNSLLAEGLDARDAAEVLQMFLTGRGYGVSRDEAREAVRRVGGSGCSLDVIQQELTRIALVQ